MAAFRTLDDIGDIRGKRVLVRVDLNVPTSEGKVTDATRIERVAPTIQELSDAGAKVILLSHFGRPKDGPSAHLSLRPVAEATAAVVGRPVAFDLAASPFASLPVSTNSYYGRGYPDLRLIDFADGWIWNGP